MIENRQRAGRFSGEETGFLARGSKEERDDNRCCFTFRFGVAPSFESTNDAPSDAAVETVLIDLCFRDPAIHCDRQSKLQLTLQGGVALQLSFVAILKLAASASYQSHQLASVQLSTFGISEGVNLDAGFDFDASTSALATACWATATCGTAEAVSERDFAAATTGSSCAAAGVVVVGGDAVCL